uniref:Uncharacterized protein n=1 Tax=Arundo donax TaxID=35708 RepID=A0A0A9AGJ5_ARUDO
MWGNEMEGEGGRSNRKGVQGKR